MNEKINRIATFQENYCKDSKNGGNCKSGLTDQMGKL